MRSARFHAAVCVSTGLLVAACAAVAPRVEIPDDLAARAEAVLAQRGLGADTLAVIDNLLRHDGIMPPPHSPPVVRELLTRPLAAANAATLFDRMVPAALRQLAIEADAPVGAVSAPVRLEDLLNVYLADLAEAQRILKPSGKAPLEARAILAQLERNLPSRKTLQDVAQAVDPVAVERASGLFLSATARFIRAVRAAGPGLRFPDRLMRFESAIGIVVIGSTGDDVHQAGAALIIDPGGNDVYERAPVVGGAVAVIVDLSGNDRYEGSDVAIHGLSAIIDFAGNDRYVAPGPGLGAAIAGASLIADFAGDDSYEANLFGQGAAVFGLGAILDLRGNDSYRVRAGGQGFAMTGGIGLLWDRAGNDSYTAGGLADVYDRGGGISMAQGAATGFRTALGGGAGILRDDAGNDVYEAQMFAQGAGYYYGLGLLWDGGGDDRYRAARYAQGAGVHEAAGVLRDESGNDSYELTVGVGQGMGLDLAVGLLFDGAGDDRYRSEVVAQGSATANGIGVLVDRGGIDEWRMGADRRSWGHAEWARRLPTTGLMLYQSTRATFLREGKEIFPVADASDLGWPLGGEVPVLESQEAPRCPELAPAAAMDLPLLDALRKSGPGFSGGAVDPAAYASARLTLSQQLRASVTGLPRDEFEVAWAMSQVLRCTLVEATPDKAAMMGKEIEGILKEDPASSIASGLAFALRDRRPPVPQMEGILDALDAHQTCGTRSAGLALRGLVAGDDAARKKAVAAAQVALGSPCWRLQATALNVLQKFGAAPGSGATLPTFLRAGLVP